MLLVSKRLSDKDCASLINKITQFISGWSANHLYYAIHLQLIHVIIFNIEKFWCQNFILPQPKVKKLIRTCTSFFWKGYNGSRKGAHKGELEFHVPF